MFEFALQELGTNYWGGELTSTDGSESRSRTMRGGKRAVLERRGSTQLLLDHMNLIHQPRQFGLERVEVQRIPTSRAGVFLELPGNDLHLMALQPCRRTQPGQPVQMRIQNRFGVFQPELVGYLAAGIKSSGQRRRNLASGSGEPLVPLRPGPAGFLRNPMSLKLLLQPLQQIGSHARCTR